MDENEKKLASILSSYVCSKNAAKIILYLLNFEKATSRDIEMTMDARQPEINVGLAELRDIGIIKMYPDKKKEQKRKGRPVLIIELVKSKKELFTWMHEKVTEKINNDENIMKELRTIITTF